MKIQCLICKKQKDKSEFTKNNIKCNSCYSQSGSSSKSDKKSGGWLDGLLDALTDW